MKKESYHAACRFVALAMSLAVVLTVQTAVRGDGPLPKFTYAGVVLQPADLKLAPVSELERASTISMEGRVQNPLGNYYLYYSPHRHVGISLAISDSITGPWKEQPDRKVQQ